MSTVDPTHDGCGEESSSPEEGRVNLPGRSALAYRIGTHSSFLERMLARLPYAEPPDGPSKDKRPLSALTTRAVDDPAIALMDSWAAVLDVLTFYQERIANEGYLRTATERRSVLELARSIGYELNPGVAASTHLSFTMDESPGVPVRARVPRGTKVQSIPGQDELPQTFETSEEMEARVEWNTLRPQLTRPQVLRVYGSKLHLETQDVEKKTLTSTPTGQIIFAGTATRLNVGDLLLVRTPTGTLVVRVSGLKMDAVAGTTTAVLAEDPIYPQPAPPSLAEGQGTSTPGRSFSGSATPAAPERGQVETAPIPLTPSNVKERIVEKHWRESALSSFLAVQRWSPKVLLRQVAALPPGAPTETEIHVFRQRVGFFGHNAPAWHDKLLPSAKDWDKGVDGKGVTIWTDSDGTAYGASRKVDVFLERSIPEVLPKGWVFIQAPDGSAFFRVTDVMDSSLADFALTGKATGLNLQFADGTGLTDEDKKKTALAFRLRKSSVFVQSERLQEAVLPITEPLEKSTSSSGGLILEGVPRLTLDRMVLGLKAGQPVVVTGEEVAGGESVDKPKLRTRVMRSEIAVLLDVEHEGGQTTLVFRNQLTYRYVRETVTINANVVAATHGETVEREVLGSGDGTRANQRFTLKKKPLTYVSAPTTRGVASTLEVRVDGVKWEEVESLHALAPDSKAYVVRIADDGAATVIFGDGQQGARLPTGTENVVARYRTGIGPSGELEDGRLSLLLSRPLGIRTVINPVPAMGAANPEVLDDARANAPLRVRSLARISSVRDYEDYARAFAGIGKAQATILWGGHARFVHLTVAAANGEPIPSDSVLYENLKRALAQASGSAYGVRVDSYQPRFFMVSAGVAVDPARVAADVRADVQATLERHFSYARRQFAQPVTASEVLSVIQGVRGVIAAHLTDFRRMDSNAPPGTVPAILLASPARWDPARDGVQAAEMLLLLKPGGVVLSEMKS